MAFLANRALSLVAAGSRAGRLLVLVLVVSALPSCVSTEETSRVESDQLLREGDDHFRRDDHEQALAAYLLAVKAASEERDPDGEAAALSQVALVYALDDDVPRALTSLDRAADLVSKSEPDGWSRFLLAKGEIARSSGDATSALRIYEELYDFASSQAQLQRAAQAAHMATLIAEGEERLDWARRGIETAEQSGQSTWLASAWLALAWINEDLGRPDDALTAFASAKRFAERTSSEDAALQADWALAHGHRMAGNLDRARSLAQRTLARAQTAYEATGGEQAGGFPEYALWVAQCYREIAELDVEAGDFELAVDGFEKARRYFVLAGLRERAPASLVLLEKRLGEVRSQAVARARSLSSSQ